MEGRTQRSPDLVRGNGQGTWLGAGAGNQDCVRMTKSRKPRGLTAWNRTLETPSALPWLSCLSSSALLLGSQLKPARLCVIKRP